MKPIHLRIDRHFVQALFGGRSWMPGHRTIEIGNTVCGADPQRSFPLSPMGSLECWEAVTANYADQELCTDCVGKASLWDLAGIEL